MPHCFELRAFGSLGGCWTSTKKIETFSYLDVQVWRAASVVPSTSPSPAPAGQLQPVDSRLWILQTQQGRALSWAEPLLWPVRLVSFYGDRGNCLMSAPGKSASWVMSNRLLLQPKKRMRGKRPAYWCNTCPYSALQEPLADLAVQRNIKAP